MRNHIEGKAGMPAQDVFNKLNDLQIVQDEPGGEWRLSMQPTDEHFAIFEKFGKSRQQVMDKFNSEIRRLNKKEKAKARNAKLIEKDVVRDVISSIDMMLSMRAICD